MEGKKDRRRDDNDDSDVIGRRIGRYRGGSSGSDSGEERHWKRVEIRDRERSRKRYEVDKDVEVRGEGVRVTEERDRKRGDDGRKESRLDREREDEDRGKRSRDGRRGSEDEDRGRWRADREREHSTRKLEEDKDGVKQLVPKTDEKKKSRGRHDSDSDEEEKGRWVDRRDRDRPVKEAEGDKDGGKGAVMKADEKKSSGCHDSNSDGEERSKRVERRESDQRVKEAEEDVVNDGRDRMRTNSRRNGSRRDRDFEAESDDEKVGRKRGEGERSGKSLEDEGDDRKVADRRDRRRTEDRKRNGHRRDVDSDSSDRETKHRRRRDIERRRHRNDDSSDSGGGRRKRDRKGERKDRSRKDRHDLEDAETRTREIRHEKGGNESKQESKDIKREEVVKPANANENPGGPAATLGRTGGVYVPPFKLARMMTEIEDKSSTEYQRLTWDALRKSINGLVNKVNATNIKNIIPELFSENLIRGRGLFCRSCMKSQMASPGFTDVFAALVAVVNTKFPEIGDLLLRRIILQLKRAYKRNDKPQLIAAVKFIAHLVNQQIAHELVALELLTVLLEQPTDDSVEVAVDFVKECGAILQDLCPKGLHGIFERFRGILHEGEIDKRVQFLIEGLFVIRKAKFQGHPAVRPELDLVEQEDQLTHEVSLEDEIDPETSLDIFRMDPNFLESERKYEELKKSILGEESDDEEDSDAGSADEDEDEDEDEEDDEEQMQIKDATETNLINLRRTIYLTIMSSVDFEEAGHKLLKIKLEQGQEMELCIMLLECCSQERTYLRYYGLLGQRFCMINKVHQENFEKCFVQQYSMIHRLETNKLRNVGKFFAHLLGTDALPWHVLGYIRLTEEDTTSSSRIFIKILFQELSEHLGIRLLNERLNDPSMHDTFESIFPRDNPRNTRFAINFFTSIGLGGLTENLREYLKNMPRIIMQQQQPASEDESGSSGSGSGSGSSSSGSDSSSSESSSDSSSDESDSDNGKSRKRRKR